MVNKSEETLKKLKSILEMIRIFFVLVKNGECYCYENIRENALWLTISIFTKMTTKRQQQWILYSSQFPSFF